VDDAPAAAHDAATGAMYGLHDGALVRIDLQSGRLTGLLDDADPLGRALTRDPESGHFFAGDADAIRHVDVEEQTVSELSTPGAAALDFDPTRRILLGVTADGDRFEIDPESGLRRSVGVLVGMAPLGLAIDDSLGRAYTLGGLPEPPDEKLRRFCADVAAVLGVPPAGRRVSAEFGNSLAAGETRVLESEGEDAPFIAYGSVDGTSQGGTLRVATAHPDAIVCVATLRERLEIVVDEEARFRLLVIVGDELSVSLDVDSGFRNDPAASIHVRAGDDVPIGGESDLVVTYSNEEWEDLGLSTLSEAPDAPATVLGMIDWQTGGSVFLELGLPRVVGALSLVRSP
jgi:hypothetical protein